MGASLLRRLPARPVAWCQPAMLNRAHAAEHDEHHTVVADPQGSESWVEPVQQQQADSERALLAPLDECDRRVGISSDTMTSMAMTLRLTDAEAQVLRRRAEMERRPMQEVVRQAIREYVESHSRAELLDQVLNEELPRYAEALQRLAQ